MKIELQWIVICSMMLLGTSVILIKYPNLWKHLSVTKKHIFDKSPFVFYCARITSSFDGV